MAADAEDRGYRLSAGAWASIQSQARLIVWDEEHGWRPCVTVFTCPRCGRSSPNPNDIREGYCGACHDWTGAPA